MNPIPIFFLLNFSKIDFVIGYLLKYRFCNCCFRNLTTKKVEGLGVVAMKDFTDPYLKRFELVLCSFNYYLMSSLFFITNIPDGIYLLKVNNRTTRTSCEICSKLTIKIPEKNGANGVVLVSLLLTLNIFHSLVQCF